VLDEWRGPESRSLSQCGGVFQNTQNSDFTYKTFRYDFGVSNNDNHNGFQYQQRFMNPGNSPVTSNCTHTGTLTARTLVDTVTGGASSSIFTWACTGPGAQFPVNSISVPHSAWIRHIWRIKVAVTETAFAAWNAQCGVTIAAGTYHQVSHGTWVEGAGSILWDVVDAPVATTQGGVANRRVLVDFTMSEDNTSTNPNPSLGTVTFTGTDGTQIAPGTQVQTSAGQCLLPRLCFTTTNTTPATISGGSLTLQAKSVGNTSGPAANISSGTSLVMAVTTVLFVVSIFSIILRSFRNAMF